MTNSPHSQLNSYILIVDDIPANVQLLSNLLVRSGYLVKSVTSGASALEVARKYPPDLILMDIMMPEISGYEVCQKLKANEQTKNIPIIFLSALDDTFDKVQAFEVGGVDYITKPFEITEAIARVETHLSLRQAQKQLSEQNTLLQQEIHDRTIAQAALEASEAKHRAVLDAIPDLMLRIAGDGTILDYRCPQTRRNENSDRRYDTNPVKHQNQLLVSDLSLLDDRILHKTIEEVLSEDLAVWMMYYVEQAIEMGGSLNGEYVQQIDGNWHQYESRFVVSKKNEVLAIVRDISDRKHIEAELLKSQALLRSQTQQLQQALNTLKKTQIQLIQRAKMAGLGQLVAGIAHEINNPIGFIYSNIAPAKEYIQQLLELLDAYQTEYPEPTTHIQELSQDIDIEFLVEDLNRLLDSMESGADRICQIVRSLRNFSRHDEAEIKSVDLHEGLDSTLLMLQHRLQEHRIQVLKEYGDLPLITCYPSQLNQVFMHVLNNAIDATSARAEPRTIEIGTVFVYCSSIALKLLDPQVLIRIRDNGCGLSPDIQEKVFNPFFTTKPVGSATGLGLSISHQIVVEQHSGQLMCFSLLDHGTELVIQIPVNIKS
jgi:signal transduction histidine kinase/DNA-binding response OmpR family regulator